MLYTPPRSTFHHVDLCGDWSPISSVLMHVAAFLSTALLALNRLYIEKEGNAGDWEANAWNDRSSVENIDTCLKLVRLLFLKKKNHCKPFSNDMKELK